MNEPSTLLRLLSALPRRTLARLLGEFDVSGPPGYRSRSVLVALLVNAPEVSVREVLEGLSAGELAGVCKSLGVVADGRRHQIVRRLLRLLRWLPFEEARAFARSLGLQSERQWREWAKGARPDLPPRSPSMPTSPSRTYRDAGWAGVGDWLGTGATATRLRVYWPYERAKRFVHGVGLRSSTEWNQWCQGALPEKPAVPPSIPHGPARTYASQWESWGEWLGTGTVNNKDREFMSYAEARRLSQSLEFTTARAWLEWRSGHRPDLLGPPSGMPAHPTEHYQDAGWRGWRHFLGASYTGPSRSFRSFRDSRRFVRSLNLTSQRAFKAWCRGELKGRPTRPHDVPTNPNLYYRDAWAGWGDFLGTGAVHPKDRNYRSFQEARAFVRLLGLRTVAEWRAWCKGIRPDLPPRPEDIPVAVERVYRLDWQGFRDWLNEP